MSFLDDFNYIISQTSNNSTRATLEKTFAMLVAQNETRNIDKLLEHWHSLQLKPFGESNIHSFAKLRVKIDEISQILRDYGWVYCPDTTPPNFTGERGWMHPYYARQSTEHHHLLYVESDLQNNCYFHVTIYHPEIKFYEHVNLDAIMLWIDKNWGGDHEDQ